MTCRSCGITIADKAIVCFKCGTPTADLAPVPRVAPPAGGKAWHRLLIVVVLSGLGVWLIPMTPEDSWQRPAAFALLAVTVFVAIRVSRGPRSGKLSRK